MTPDYAGQLLEVPVRVPPRDTRSLNQRFEAADRQWRDLMMIAGAAGKPSMAGTATIYLHLKNFLNELVDNRDLRDRVLQHIEMRMREDFPPAPGKML